MNIFAKLRTQAENCFLGPMQCLECKVHFIIRIFRYGTLYIKKFWGGRATNTYFQEIDVFQKKSVELCSTVHIEHNKSTGIYWPCWYPWVGGWCAWMPRLPARRRRRRAEPSGSSPAARAAVTASCSPPAAAAASCSGSSPPGHLGWNTCNQSTDQYPQKHVADPDPHVFGPPGSGSTSLIRIRFWIRILLSSCKKSKKTLDSYFFVTLFDFLSLKNDVKVPLKKVISRKNCVKKLVFRWHLEYLWRK